MRGALAIAVFALGASSCAAPYTGPTDGPVAFVRFIDGLPRNVLGGRRTAVALYADARCSGGRNVPGTEWVPVRAGVPFAFVSLVDDRGSGPFAQYCAAFAMLDLRVGQRVQIHYERTGPRQCTLSATDLSVSPAASIALGRPGDSTCRYPK